MMQQTGEGMNEKEYAMRMIKHHQDALTMSRSLLRGKPRQRIKAFAEKVVEVQSKEIEWLKEWLRVNT